MHPLHELNYAHHECRSDEICQNKQFQPWFITLAEYPAGQRFIRQTDDAVHLEVIQDTAMLDDLLDGWPPAWMQ